MSLQKYFALSFGPLVFLLLTAVALVSLSSAPRLPGSFEWSDGRWVVSEGAPPLSKGDRLESVAGQPADFHSLLVDNMHIASKAELRDWFDRKARLYDALQGRSEVALVVRRAHSANPDETVNLRLPVNRGGWQFLASSALMHGVVALVFLLVGWATYRRPGAGRQAFVFYLMCFSMSLVYLTNMTSLMVQPVASPSVFSGMNRLNLVNFVLAPLLLFHFSLLLPRTRSQFWMGALLGPSYLAAVWVIGTTSIPGQGVLVPLLFLGSLLAIGQASWAYRGAVERQQMKWVGVGFLLGVGPWFAINGLPLLLIGQRGMSDTVPGACLVFIPIFMAVAVQRYRLFDIGVFLEGTLAYLITVGVLIFAEVAVLTALAPNLQLGEPYLVSIALLLGLYGPIRERLSLGLARLFYRTQPTSEEALRLLRSQITGMSSQGIREGLEETVRSLWAPSPLTPAEVAEGQEVGARLELTEPPTVLLTVAPDVALRCGPLPRGRHYTSRVMRELQLLTEQAGLYHQAALYYAQADQERQRRLEERERLLGDLHDGVGSALAGIRMMSTEPRVVDMAGDALFELQNFLYDSPDYTLERAHFTAEIRGYARRLFEGQRLALEFRVVGSETGTLPRGVALSLFRLVREAMCNALKHSKGSRFGLELAWSDQRLEAVLEDDGVGIEGEAQGRGMSGMKSRVADLGGELRVSTVRGVRLEVSLPL